MKLYWKDTGKTILVREMPNSWEWVDYLHSTKTMHKMLMEVDHEVYIIIDACQVDSLPKGCMIYLNEGHRNIPAHVKMRILVCHKRSVRSIASLLVRAVPHNFQNFFCASTLEEAYQLIDEAHKKPVEAIEESCA